MPLPLTPIYVHVPPGQPPPSLHGHAPYRAVVIAETQVDPDWQQAMSQALVESGCLYMLAWGVESSAWDDAVDNALLEKFDYGEIPDDADIMTTWHEDELLSEVVWQALNLFVEDQRAKSLVLLHVADRADEARIMNQSCQRE